MRCRTKPRFACPRCIANLQNNADPKSVANPERTINSILYLLISSGKRPQLYTNYNGLRMLGSRAWSQSSYGKFLGEASNENSRNTDHPLIIKRILYNFVGKLRNPRPGNLMKLENLEMPRSTTQNIFGNFPNNKIQ